MPASGPREGFVFHPRGGAVRSQPLIALATCRRLADLNAEDKLLAAQLEQLGFASRPIVWDDPEQRLDNISAVIVRSCWDYQFRPEQFLMWAEKIRASGVQLFNPVATLRWNHDKRYLRELASLGVPVPETAWFEPGTSAALPHVMENYGWKKSVLKPAISATAWNTFLVTQDSSSSLQTKFNEMLAAGAVMLQRFIETITTAGEWSFIFFGDQFSHAILKRPQSGDFRVQTEFGGTVDHNIAPPRALIEEARTILNHVSVQWLYARVDAIDVAGHLCLIEVELIEPALFLHSSQTAAKFASAIASAVEQSRNSDLQ
jgi:glutathione synthase/RimK-type ligase-like ATP-grasp enzyme